MTSPRLRMVGVRSRVLPTLLILVLAACSSTPPPAAPAPAPPPREESIYQEGLASWYGPGFEGRATASGEVFDPDSLTAAHRRLPFGSRVRVVNVENGNEVVVRINDRGPWIDGRVIDLSRAAARVLDMIDSGVARVRLFLEGS